MACWFLGSKKKTLLWLHLKFLAKEHVFRYSIYRRSSIAINVKSDGIIKHLKQSSYLRVHFNVN